MAGEGVGKSAAKVRGVGRSAGEGAARGVSLQGIGAASSPALLPAPRIFAALFPAPSPVIFWAF